MTRAPTQKLVSAHRNDPMCDIDDAGRNRSSAVSSNAAARSGHPTERLEGVRHALRRAGAARREEDRRRRIRRRGRERDRPGIAGHECLEVHAAAADVPADVYHPDVQFAREAARGEVVGALGVRRARPPADGQRVVDLRCGVAVVERCRHQSGLEAREVVHDQREPVRHQRRDAVTHGEAEPEVVRRQTRAASSSARHDICSSTETIATVSGSAPSPTSRRAEAGGRRERPAFERHGYEE